jgi:Zn-dependent protease
MTHNSSIKSIFHFSPQEKKDLIISWITLSLAFAVVISPRFFNTESMLVSLPIALVGVGTGFVLHELAHREAAKSFGFHSEFRAWYPGLGLAIILAIVTFGQFTFAAPGATYFFGHNVSRRQNGIISAAGPAINIVIGLLLMTIGIFSSGFVQYILIAASTINFWLALFNLIPIYPLDGSKIVAWKPTAWLLLAVVSGFFVFAPGILF